MLGGGIGRNGEPILARNEVGNRFRPGLHYCPDYIFAAETGSGYEGIAYMFVKGIQRICNTRYAALGMGGAAFIDLALMQLSRPDSRRIDLAVLSFLQSPVSQTHFI